MKQILVVLLVTALAAGTFVILRLLDEPTTPPAVTAPGAANVDPAPRPVVDAPQTRRPNLPGTGAAGSGASGSVPAGQGSLGKPALSPAAQELVDRMAATHWEDSAHGDLLVPEAERWCVDLSAVDLAADPVLRYEGGEITQAEYRQALCLWLLEPLLDALAALEVHRTRTRDEGQEPYALSPELLERRFELWCEAREIEPDFGRTVMAHNYKMPAAAARAFYDTAAQVLLADATGAGREEQLLARFLVGTPTGEADAVGTLVRRLEAAWTAVQAGQEQVSDVPGVTLEAGQQVEPFGLLLGAVDQLAILAGARTALLQGRRNWTTFDHPLPEDAVFGVALDALPPGTPPWLAERQTLLRLGDLWPLLEGQVSPALGQRVLEDLLFQEVVRGELAARGVLPADEEAWRVWSDEFEAGLGTLLGSRTLYVDVLGYPSLAVMRATKRLLAGYERLQPAGWQGRAVLEPFFERNRMFIEAWNADVILALFLTVPAEDPWAAPDWAGSHAAAQAMAAQVAAGGNFADLARDHTNAQAAAFQENRGRDAGEGFADVFHMGRIQSSVADLGRRLQETYYRRFPGAGSAIYSAVAARAQGQLQGPFRTPRGYVLLQVEGGGRSILEPEFEDVEFQAREFHRDWSFTAWANGTMRERGFAGPCH